MSNVLGFHAGECRAFVVDGQQVGLVRPDVMKELLNHPEVILHLNFEKYLQGGHTVFIKILERNGKLRNIDFIFASEICLNLVVSLQGKLQLYLSTIL